MVFILIDAHYAKDKQTTFSQIHSSTSLQLECRVITLESQY